ncbi:MAG: fumarylacetoacetate hydrolase family protein [Rhodospirillaceae bacterium]|nr:fumarylacetoacetate hydrolase family protein [Rhodospirillaceae bacterium]
MMSPAAVAEAVELLLAARADHRRLEAFPPSCRPADFDDGYAIQEAFLRAWPAPVAGYKIGCTSPEAQAYLGAPGPFPGRVFAPVRLDSPARVAAKAFHRLGIEPEFAFTLARDLPPRATPYSAGEVADAVAAVHGAIEIVDSRWADWMKVGIASIVADNGANGALVLGPPVADWRGLDLAAAKAILRFDDRMIAEGAGAAALGGPMNALVWLANDLSRRGYGLKAGDAVTTGTVANIHFAAPGMQVSVDFGAIGRVELRAE